LQEKPRTKVFRRTDKESEL